MEMKKQADQIKRELDQITIEVADVKGIKVTISGSQDFRSIEIDQSLLTADNKNRIQGDLLKSLNSAVKKSQAAAAQKMSAFMPGI
jgi:DNA-binding protein YbaB